MSGALRVEPPLREDWAEVGSEREGVVGAVLPGVKARGGTVGGDGLRGMEEEEEEDRVGEGGLEDGGEYPE